MAAASTEEEDDEYKSVVKTYIAERLRQNHLSIPGYDETLDITTTTATTTTKQREQILNVAATLRRVGDELEASNSQFFNQMFTQIHITPNTVYSTFKGIADEIFLSGKNWGRIVAFLTFGSTLAVHCAHRDDLGPPYVDRVVAWVSKYMSAHLSSWMKQHGDWEGLIAFFDKPDGVDPPTPSGFIVSALAGLGVGAIIMMTFK